MKILTAQSGRKLEDYIGVTQRNPDHIEQEILLAYVQLAVVPDWTNGTRTATLVRFNAVEVRLIEVPQPKDALPIIPPFWLEVYCHATGTTLDSCGCFEFDETELAIAVDLVWEALEEAALRVGSGSCEACGKGAELNH